MNLLEEVVGQRDEKGEILPVEVEVEINGKKHMCLVKPVPVGVFNSFFNTYVRKLKEEEYSEEAITAMVEVISEYYVEPKFTLEDAKNIKLGYIKPLLEGVLKASGFAKP